MSSSHPDNEESKGYSAHMRGVALGILVMGVSLALIILLWIQFGYIGPAFSTQTMQRQQESLRQQYGLPPESTLSPEMLEVPPSLRSVAAGTNATTAAGTNATTAAGTNATTAAGTNATTAAGTNATTAAGTTGNTTGTSATSAGGGTTVSIVPGSSTLTDTAFSPNPVEVSVGDTVTWTNDDTQPHTVVSGENAQPSGEFDSSPNFNPLIAPGQTFSHTFTEAGQY